MRVKPSLLLAYRVLVRLKVYNVSKQSMFSFNNEKLDNNMRERRERAKNQ